jgi:uncharacterized membrane protein HdeD (DUF308 family)
MKTKNVLVLLVGVAEIIMGITFLMNTATDIQLGFGVVLLAQGIIHLAK